MRNRVEPAGRDLPPSLDALWIHFSTHVFVPKPVPTFGRQALGVMYETGSGLPRDEVQALKWFSLAVGSARKAEVRDRVLKHGHAIAAKMSHEQIAEATRLAQEWSPKNPE